jgi:hypothetical protein
MGRYGAGSPTLGRMGRFVPGPGLDERIAAGVMRRRADALIRDTEALIRVYAPPAKVWVTAHDERVRPTHNEAAGTRSEVTVRGSRVRGVVEVPFPRVVESNFPSSPDTGGGWANKALADARRRA